jgi:hypothetical protein
MQDPAWKVTEVKRAGSVVQACVVSVSSNSSGAKIKGKIFLKIW